MSDGNPLLQHLSHLDSWEIIFEVVECGSITLVANKHRLERTQLSRRISQFEDELGTRLFERRGKLLMPTQKALDMKERLQPGIVSYKHAMGSLRVSEDLAEGCIRLGAMPGFMQLQIVPHIIEFQRLYPRISFDVTTCNSPDDYMRGQTDIMFYYGPVAQPHLVEYWVSNAILMSCASPEYLARYGVPKRPEDLQRFAGVAFCGKQRDNVEYLEYRGEKVHFSWKSVIRFNNILSVKAAIIKGGGIALDIPLHHCYEELMNGTLVPVFKTWHPPVLQNYVAVTRAASRLKRMQLFIEWYLKQRQAFDKEQRVAIHKRFGMTFNL